MPLLDNDEKLARTNDAQAKRSRWDRDIARDYPPPGDLEARAACERDFRLFCEWYFPAAFPLPWSDDHLKVIARMQDVILGGGLFALAMPRGTGKTTLAVRAALWAILYGHRRFVSLVAATEGLAERLLIHFKTELTYNDSLSRDHRQVCYPINRLENNGRKAIGQLFDGEQTRITWGRDRLTLPIMPDSACDGTNVSGSTITVAGLTGSLRGQSATLPSGEIIRPELVLLDDPQTRESAMSPSQSAAREAIIKGDVLGMAGPDRRIAALMACTVIRKGDMADLMLDRERNPAWAGQKAKLVYSFPDNDRLWDEYRRLWSDEQKESRGTAAATDFYRERRADMDAGAVVAWPQRHYPDELSAVQHAMNLRFLDEPAFFAEYQNEPMAAQDSGPDDLTPDQIASKINRIPRRHIPQAADVLTAFVDVQGSLLYYLVCAWEPDFTGYIVDYGTFPDQPVRYFTLRDARMTLDRAVKAAGLEGQIRAGLEALVGALMSADWPRDDGASLKVDRCLIDANWGASTAVVKEFCRQSPNSANLTPSHGKYIGASGAPMGEWPRKAGEKAGLNWRIRSMEASRAVRSAIYDTNYWKSFIFSRLSTAMGDKGCLSLFGDKPGDHRLLCDHLTAEYRVRTSGRGREVDEWKLRPERPDNHWFDCLVGCGVAASIQGVSLAETTIRKPAAASKSSWTEFRRRVSERQGRPRQFA